LVVGGCGSWNSKLDDALVLLPWAAGIDTLEAAGIESGAVDAEEGPKPRLEKSLDGIELVTVVVARRVRSTVGTIAAYDQWPTYKLDW
jgi:hypothetical protein